MRRMGGRVEHLLHEHLAPVVTFSVWAFSQLQCIAACLPQEHVASFAQIHPPSRPQQVAGTAAIASDMMIRSCWYELSDWMENGC